MVVLLKPSDKVRSNVESYRPNSREKLAQTWVDVYSMADAGVVPRRNVLRGSTIAYVPLYYLKGAFDSVLWGSVKC